MSNQNNRPQSIQQTKPGSETAPTTPDSEVMKTARPLSDADRQARLQTVQVMAQKIAAKASANTGTMGKLGASLTLIEVRHIAKSGFLVMSFVDSTTAITTPIGVRIGTGKTHCSMKDAEAVVAAWQAVGA